MKERERERERERQREGDGKLIIISMTVIGINDRIIFTRATSTILIAMALCPSVRTYYIETTGQIEPVILHRRFLPAQYCSTSQWT